MRKPRNWLVVSVHDVAPATAAAARAWCEDLDRIGIPASLLVVPGRWQGRSVLEDAELAVWLHERARSGDEIVQHGWHHAAVPGPRWRDAIGTLVARGAAEFWSLDDDEARRRLTEGRSVLRRIGLEPAGFTPPGWLASAGTLRALRALGYRYTTNHRGVLDLASGMSHKAFALSHRPGGRGERLGAEFMVRAASRAAAAGRSVRIALHPGDLGRAGLREATLAAIDAVLAAGARPLTYGSVVDDRLPAPR